MRPKLLFYTSPSLPALGTSSERRKRGVPPCALKSSLQNSRSLEHVREAVKSNEWSSHSTHFVEYMYVIRFANIFRSHVTAVRAHLRNTKVHSVIASTDQTERIRNNFGLKDLINFLAYIIHSRLGESRAEYAIIMRKYARRRRRRRRREN